MTAAERRSVSVLITPFLSRSEPIAGIRPLKTENEKRGIHFSDCGYIHKRKVLTDSGDPAHVSMPGVHRIATLLKRRLLGTHQGSVSKKHLNYYLDEYTFRFNRRKSRSRGMLFYRLVEQAVATLPVTYRQIVKENEIAGERLRSMDTPPEVYQKELKYLGITAPLPMCANPKAMASPNALFAFL